MTSSVRLLLKVLSAFAFAGAFYWIISTIKINPFSVEPEPVVTAIGTLIALIVSFYERKEVEPNTQPTKQNILTIQGNGNTALQDVQNTHINTITQNNYGSGDNVAGDKIQK